MKFNLIKKSFCYILAIIFIINPILSYSQSDYENHRKYWYYKSRLNNDFVKVGLGAGESLPFNMRGFWEFDFTNNQSVILQTGDGTSTLGYYIGLLATEYYLLNLNSQNTDRVRHELFCALNTFNRLDAKAEDLSNATTTYGALNGFFIRDDTPSSLITNNYEHFNYFTNGGSTSNNQPSRGFASKFNAGSKKIISCWTQDVEVPGAGGLFYESQDQVYNLLFGLALVNKFVPASETDGSNVFGYGSNETSLTVEARNIAGRLIDHIRDSKHVTSGASCGGSLSPGWKIYNPNTCNEVTIGANAQAFAYPLAEIECLIKNGMSSNSGTSVALGVIPHLCSGNGYHNTWSNTLGYTTWNTLAGGILPNIDNRVFVENLSAICNCSYGTVADKFIEQTLTWMQQVPVLNWLGVVIGWAWSLASAVISTFVPGFTVNTTSTSINLNAYVNNSPLDHGPLARKVLHGGVYTQNPDYGFLYLLNTAPCDDIYYLPNEGNNYGHYEWSSSDRLDHPERRGGNEDFRGEYNGIDYMLYHNLWYIHQSQEGSNPTVSDLSNIYIDQPTGLGCGNVNAYETITTNNTNVTCTSPTAWRAGKTIYFGSGTTITGNGSGTSGPNFHAYIQKFDCSSDVGAFRMAGSDSTEQEHYGTANDSYEQGARYHTVNYPKQPTEIAQDISKTTADENYIIELPIEDNPLENMMKAAYPNYSKELFVKPTVTIEDVRVYFTLADDELAFIHIVDLNGKVLYTKGNLRYEDTGLRIDLSDYAQGTYLLKFTSTKGTDKTEKIIKQ